MLGRLLKPFLPRGLYWRAALIVFLPVVTILLVMSVAFIQRHYDGVTRQMSRSASREIVLVVEEIDAGGDRTGGAVARGLAIAVKKGDRELADAFNYALKTINDSGKFEELYLRYFPLGLF